MHRTYGTVTTDTTLPGQGDGPYLFFVCSATGIQGELWGAAMVAAETALREMPSELAQAILRQAGNLVGGDVSREVSTLLAQSPHLDHTGRLRFPGRLEERDGAQVFVDGSGVALPVHGRSAWRQHHGESTGVPLSKTRDFWCGGTPDSPAFYGSEREGSADASVLSYRTHAVPAQLAASESPRRRARPR